MSEDNDEADVKMMCCASCGVAGGDDIKLKKCTACHLVKYCSDECQKEHRPQHKRECKKRAAELHDELLFKQPVSSHHGDCPICCLPLPIDPEKSSLFSCCSKRICHGCDYANQKREIEGRLQRKCPFCRKAVPKTDEEVNEQYMKRVEANDPVAMNQMGGIRYYEGDYKRAFEYWTKAAALGDVEAHYQLSCLYRDGQGVEKDEKKQLHHAEQAAVGGHHMARHNLGCVEGQRGHYDRAVKHFIIAAKLGDDQSSDKVKRLYKDGYASKDDFAAALLGHQAAIDATKSSQREEAAERIAEVNRQHKPSAMKLYSCSTLQPIAIDLLNSHRQHKDYFFSHNTAGAMRWAISRSGSNG
eukprot:scaffold5150_cov133-Skeletonema_menzelii.AAC.5